MRLSRRRLEIKLQNAEVMLEQAMRVISRLIGENAELREYILTPPQEPQENQKFWSIFDRRGGCDRRKKR